MKRLLKYIFIPIFASLFLFIPNRSYAKDELKNTDPDKYYIVVDLTNQLIRVYEKDNAGEYTKIVRTFICSTGAFEEDGDEAENTPTPTGIWKIGGRERWGKFAKFSEYARYWTQLVSDIYFHSVMYKKNDLLSLDKGAYAGLGGARSHGCIRLLVEDAKWMYYYACPGTTVNVTKKEKMDKSLQYALRRSRNLFDVKEYEALQANFYDGNEELPNDKCWVTNEKATINAENKSASRKYMSLNIGDELEILLYNDAWLKVKTAEGKQGYIYRGYISLDKDTVDTVENAYVMKVTSWVFSEPKEDSDKRLVKAPFDTTIKVLEKNDSTGFYKIEYQGIQGYVNQKRIRQTYGIDLGYDIESVPVITPSPKPANTPKPTKVPKNVEE